MNSVSLSLFQLEIKMQKNSLHLTLFTLIITLFLYSCQEKSESGFNPNLKGKQIAFMADVHLQDVHGTFEGTDYRGIKNPKSDEFVTIRTMNAQLRSTRLFNENYFAFIAALNDVVKRGVKYVVLPGDFSDDGQPVNVRGIKRILDEYRDKHGIKFIATTGNHDPCRPFDQDAGKKDFLGLGGKRQPIMSKESMYTPNPMNEHQVIVTPDIRNLGYDKIITLLGDYGFFPQENHLYWETPFSTYKEETYSYDKALKASILKQRNYPIPPNGISIPDVSYLVEPEEGLWFLAIDANVYIPKEKATIDSLNPENYKSPSIGYSNLLTHKKHLIKWIKKVTQRAEELGKVVIAFSHYPMVEFNDDATTNIENLLGKGAMQTHRVPPKEVAKLFADAGLKVHFGGHMHINDTGLGKSDSGNTLINVQIPSLAAYIPAYKLLTIQGQEKWEVETIVIDSVPDFKEFFSLYQMEYDFLQSVGAKNIWNKDILKTETYKEYTMFHLRELVRLRFLPKDWPSELREFLLRKTGKELLIWGNLSTEDKINYNTESLNDKEQKAVKIANSNNIRYSNLSNWNGANLVYDLYRLRSADKLAIIDITPERIHEYTVVLNAITQNQTQEENSIQKSLQELTTIFKRFLNGAPAGHFIIIPSKGVVQEANKNTPN